MEAMLGRFKDGFDAAYDFVWEVLKIPTSVSLGYALWLGFRGEGWWWLLPAFAVIFGGFGELGMRFYLANVSNGFKRFIGYMLSAIFGLMFVVGVATMWIRLIFVGVLAGLYHNLFVEFSLWGIALALETISRHEGERPDRVVAMVMSGAMGRG
jgi:hypothetical protein